jgi:Tol biopolymer transport system component
VSLSQGTRLGPYEVLGPLGAGGMGEVYRARDTKLHRDVALKILPETFVNDPDRLARFTREAHTLAALNHPHIGAIYGLEETTSTSGQGGVQALVMELVEGDDLSQRLARGAIPLDEALPMALQIADGLEAAHERGIIHRDLKPANIKVRADGTVKVLDFGLAKALDPSDGDPSTPLGAGRQTADDRRANSPTITSPAAMTLAGVILGTAAYMSPEQARGQAVDARTDLWAFGCVLCEMLTGTRAFPGESLTDTLAAVVKEEPKWDALPLETPAAIHRLLRRCLVKDRKRRLASASDARLEIEEALTPTASAAAQQNSAAPRRSARVFAAGLGAGLVVAGGVFMLWNNRSREPSAPAAVTRLVIQAPPGAQIVTGHRELAVSADGRLVAFIARGSTEQHIYVRRLDELESRQVPSTDGARDLTFSPDGHWLAFHSGNKIRKVSLAGGAPAVLADAVHSHGLAWHPTEDAIYFAPSQTGSIWKVPAGGDAAVEVTTLDKARGELSHEWPTLSADGRTLLFSVNAVTADFDKEDVSLLNIQSGARDTVRTGGDAVALIDNGGLLFVREHSLMIATLGATRDAIAQASEIVPGVSNTVGGYGAVLSFTGTLAYVPAPDEKRRSLIWISPDGKETATRFGPRSFRKAALSADGRRVAVVAFDGSDNSLYLGDVSDGTLTRMAAVSSAGGLAWSADGKWIAGSISTAGQDALARISAVGGRSWEPLLMDEARNAAQQWTPDGRGLVFTRREGVTGRETICLLSLTSSPPKWSVIVDGGEARVRSASLSPDGRWLTYESDESGRPEIYIQGFPTPAGRVQVSRNGGTKPRWAKSSNHVYFISGTTLMMSSVTTRPALHAEAPHPIVDEPLLLQEPASSRYDVAPDGRILAIKEDDSVRSDHIVVVQNWLSEARSRLAQQK